MKKLYPSFTLVLITLLLSVFKISAQPCSTLVATCTGYESRCAATGSIKILASGGSGSYKYRTVGPVTTNYTSTDSITGLSAGTYTVYVNDIITNCTYSVSNVIVNGVYQDPRFTLNKVDVTCDNGNNGSISLNDQQHGLSPFTYTIVAPSPMGVGTTNNTGNFENLSAGNYAIQLTDSCGGIQTRQITINNYTWQLVAYPFVKTSCYEADGYIKVVDSRGNISTVGGIPGFSYGIVLTAGDTLWSSDPNFHVYLFAISQFQVVARDTCGTVKAGAVAVQLDLSVGANVLITNQTCSTFTASLQDVRNFFNGQFCLYDAMNSLIACNTTGVFDNLPYGDYCINAYDMCVDINIRRCFSAGPPPIVVASEVLVRNKTCIDFTADISRNSGLTNPEFCLYDAANLLLGCNTTGIFNNLAYGNYCITIADRCRDTTISRCFTAIRPTPFIPVLVPSYVNCINFGLDVGGDTLGSPRYCLYDSVGVLITCNNTGIFDSLALGPYCVEVYDSCYDTTITRCIAVGMPVITNDLELRSRNKTCTNFTLTASGASLLRPEFCLYNAADSLLACNLTGIFDSLAYGTYCVKAHSACPDTIMVQCITVVQPVPAVNAIVSISNRNCTSFRATITDPENLTNPQYCLYDQADNMILCNQTGVFSNLAYGSYCIKITDGCYDTTIVRCFTADLGPINMNVSASKSCALDYAKFSLNFSNATAPVHVRILRPDGSVFSMASYPSLNFTIDSIPGVPAGQFYKLIAEDFCGRKDSAQTGAEASNFSFRTTVTLKCPGSTWANGSGDVTMTVNTNLGSLTVRLVEKDGVPFVPALVPNTVSGNAFTFSDLGPGVYILRSSESRCNQFVMDTITVNPYQFPNLDRSSAYQCDEGGFSISAIATNGVAPFSYSIIGSVPASPSIIAGPQVSPIFNVNNGTTYSLIRLRALDACGNATLGDASILPLTNNGIFASANCLYYPTTLSVDTIMNADYKWYKKANASATDSVLVSTTPGVFIPNLLPSDTGIYVCYVDVNLGCIKRVYQYRISGACSIILPVRITGFRGNASGTKNELYWSSSQEQYLLQYSIERQRRPGVFETIGSLPSKAIAAQTAYHFTDEHPLPGKNIYRLRFTDESGVKNYTNTIQLQADLALPGIEVFPNPVPEKFSIRFSNALPAYYEVRIATVSGSQIYQQKLFSSGSSIIQILRPSHWQPGVYIISLTDMATKKQVHQKLIFL